MHQPIRDHLETYLRDSNDRRIPQEFRAHLAACRSCETQLGLLAEQSHVLRVLQDKEQPDLAAGFYARVINRIETHKGNSFWAAFLEPALGTRLAYACAALVLVLGTYLITTEPADHGAGSAPTVVQGTTYPELDRAVRTRDTDAVLVSLASFQE